LSACSLAEDVFVDALEAFADAGEDAFADAGVAPPPLPPVSDTEGPRTSKHPKGFGGQVIS